MADVLAEAVVELEADVDKANKELKAAFKQMDKDAKQAADDIDKSFKKMTGNLGKDFEKATKEIAKQYREQEREAKRAQREIEKEQRGHILRLEREARVAARHAALLAREVAAAQKKAQEDFEKEYIASQKAMEKATRESQERNAAHFKNTVSTLRKFASERFSLTLGVDSSQIAGALKSATKLGAVLGAVGIGSLAGSSGLAGLAYVTQAIQELVGAIALLPAAGAAAGIVVGTLTLGLKGLGDAISADSPKELAEAMEELSGNGKKFVTTIRDLKDEFKDLGKAVQQELLVDFNKQIEKLAKTYLPLLREGFTGVAKQLNLSARAFGDFLTQAQTTKDVSRIFKNTELSVAVFRKALEPLAGAFRDLAAVGSDFLPIIATELGQAAKRFGDFIARARESGELKTFFENALDSLNDFIDVLGNLGSIFNAVMGAAEASLGGGFLDLLSNATQALEDFLESSRGQMALIQFFEGAQEAAKLLLPVLGDLARLLLEVVLPAFTELGKVAAPGLAALVDGLRRGLESAIPGIVSFVDSLSSIVISLVDAGVLDALGDFVRVLGTSLGAALRAITPKLGDLINSILLKLTDILPDLLPPLSRFVNAFFDLAMAALPVVDILAKIISDVGLPTLQKIAETLAPIIEDLAKSLSEVLLPVLPDLVDAIMEWVDAMGPLVDDILVLAISLLRILLPLLPPLIRAGTEIARAFGPLVKLFADILDPLSKLILKFLEIPAVRMFLEQHLPFIIAMIGNIVTPIAKVIEGLTWLYEKLDEAGVIDGFLTAMGFLITVLTGAGGAFGHLWSIVSFTWNAIMSIIDFAIDFVARTVNDGLEWIKGIWNDAWEWVKGIFRDAWEWIKGLARDAGQFLIAILTGNFDQLPAIAGRAMERLGEAFRQGFDRLLQLARELPGRILTALGDMNNLLFGLGQDLVSGMIRGIGSMAQSLGNKAAEMARNAFNSAKAALLSNSPSKLTIGLGQDFGEGFIIGIQEMQRRAREIGAALATGTVMASTSALAPGDNSTHRMNEALNRLTHNGYGPAPVAPAPARPETPPVTVAPEVRVFIGNEELTDYVTEVVDEKNRRTKRSLNMGAGRRV